MAKKEHIPWNKGKKGCINSGSFKEGHKNYMKNKLDGKLEEIKGLYNKDYSLKDLSEIYGLTPQAEIEVNENIILEKLK